jgi:hypothetical protein
MKLTGWLVPTLLLSAAGLAWGGPTAVEIRLENYRAKDKGLVVLDDYDGSTVGGAKVAADGTCVIEDVPPGKYVVRVIGRIGHFVRELGTEVHFVHELGTQKVELAGDKRVQVTIRLEDPLNPDLRVLLEGTLEVPTAWGKVDVALKVKPREVPEWARAPEARLDGKRWSCSVVPGSYVIEVSPLTYQVAVHVPRQGLRDVSVVVPEPVDVVLRTVDADSGSEADVSNVVWHAKWAETWKKGEPLQLSRAGVSVSAPGGDFGMAARNADSTFRFRAPKGRLVVRPPSWPEQPEDSGYYEDESEYDIGPGPAELTLRVQKECGVVVKLSPRIDLDDERFLNPSGYGLRLEGPGEERNLRKERDHHSVRIWLTRPGKYRFSSDVLGVPSQEVVVKPGEFAEVRGR